MAWLVHVQLDMSTVCTVCCVNCSIRALRAFRRVHVSLYNIGCVWIVHVLTWRDWFGILLNRWKKYNASPKVRDSWTFDIILKLIILHWLQASEECLMGTGRTFWNCSLEAVAAHKPVIACNSRGPVETIKNGMTGFLCEPSPQEFSLAMAKFILGPQLAERMGAEARQHVTESFSTKTFGQNLNWILVDIGWGKREWEYLKES